MAWQRGIDREGLARRHIIVVGQDRLCIERERLYGDDRQAECFPQQLIAIFGAKNECVYYTEFAIKAFRIYLCMMIFACVNKACFIFLQAVCKALSICV